jgi:hypothetical protein
MFFEFISLHALYISGLCMELWVKYCLRCFKRKMAKNCIDQLQPFFTYLKVQLIFSYNSTDTTLPKTNRFSFVSFILLCSSVTLYMIDCIGAFEKLLPELRSDVINDTKLKIHALVYSMKGTLIVISMWVLPFSFKSRQILEHLVRHLQIVDDLIGQKIDRTRTIHFAVAGFICIKLMLFLACSPFLARGYPLTMLIVVLNEIFVNIIEDSVEHIFVVFCAEITVRLKCFKVKISTFCYATCSA